MIGSSTLAANTTELRISRSLLGDQATERLRNAIITGVIAPGSRLVEEDLARLLGVSRVPTREALNALEREGLVVKDGSRGRTVFQPKRKDIEELYEVRLPLERLAVRRAAKHTSAEYRAALLARLHDLDAAIDRANYAEFIQADMALHRQAWQQTGNGHLLRTLTHMVGLIFMVTYGLHAREGTWDATLREHDRTMHRTLVEAINAGDADAAERSVEEHLSTALQLLPQFHLSE